MPQEAHVAVLDVAAVFTKMNGDAVGAAEQRKDSGGNRVGLRRPPGLPHGRHMIDVDTQSNHCALPWDRIPILSSRKTGIGIRVHV